MGASKEDFNLRKKKIAEILNGKLKKYVREFSLLHDEIVIYEYGATDANAKKLFNYDLKNGEKILIQSIDMFEKNDYTITLPDTARKPSGLTVLFPGYTYQITLSREGKELFDEIWPDLLHAATFNDMDLDLDHFLNLE